DLPRSGRLLAVDWGEKRIGLALSDPSQTLAQPLDTLVRRAGRRFPMRSFRELVDAHHPTGIVVGLPLEPEGSEGEAASAAREMGTAIAKATGVPVAFVDERMTTRQVHRAVAEMGGRTRGREAEVDRLAATVLLQSFLDHRRP
ncbi:MAG: Holliday junction resolvase RuvX, partial [Gemmatimonadetes bacterium]|nr:Holliday junction resolvase RuvX [Gemmatimonadota bacterium]